MIFYELCAAIIVTIENSSNNYVLYCQPLSVLDSMRISVAKHFVTFRALHHRLFGVCRVIRSVLQ